MVLAGGEGTRLRPLTNELPKAMISIAGKPFLEYQINLLKRNSVDDLVICIGHKGEVIRGYFGDGRTFGIGIRYSEDGDRLLGTGGSLKKARALLSERFFITFGDAYPILDYKSAWNHFLSAGKIALMVVNKNSDKYARSNTVLKDGLVAFYSKKERIVGMEYIEFGVTFMHKQALDMIPDESPADLESLYRRLISLNELAGLEVNQRIYDIGSPEGLSQFRELVETGQLLL